MWSMGELVKPRLQLRVLTECMYIEKTHAGELLHN